MARTRRCNDYISEELIFDILSWLPVKSLLRFKSVCKLWLFIILSPSFVQTHLANSHKKQAVLLNYRYNRPTMKYIEVHDTHQKFAKLYVPPYVTDLCYINSCDGLVCLSDFNTSVIHIWNPATKRLKLLPTPIRHRSSDEVHMGLGFDSLSNDYKVLRIVYKYLDDITCVAEPELYSANADSWKEIQLPEQLQQIWIPYAEDSILVYATSGVLYMTLTRYLLAFDLHNEVFQVYPFPNFKHTVLMSDVLDFEGYVALIFQGSNGSAPSLYMFDVVCGEVSWTKMFNLEADIKINWVIRYLGFGQFIAHKFTGNNCVFKYDYKKGETKKLLLHLSLSTDGYPVKYTESLVSLKGFEQV